MDPNNNAVSVIRTVLSCFSEHGFTVQDGWVVGYDNAAVLIAAESASVVKVIIMPPLIKMRFESTGSPDPDSLFLCGMVRLFDEEGVERMAYKHAHLAISLSGLDRVVVLFEITDDADARNRLVDDEIMPLMNHALGFLVE